MPLLTNPLITGVLQALGEVNFSIPVLRTGVALGTAYQANDPSRLSVMYITLNSSAALSLTAGTTIAGEVRIGPDATVATGGGNIASQYKNSLTGTLTIGINMQTENTNTLTFLLPVGWYFAVRQITGTGLVITSAYDQPRD